jgi:hypothetical protein
VVDVGVERLRLGVGPCSDFHLAPDQVAAEVAQLLLRRLDHQAGPAAQALDVPGLHHAAEDDGGRRRFPPVVDA